MLWCDPLCVDLYKAADAVAKEMVGIRLAQVLLAIQPSPEIVAHLRTLFNNNQPLDRQIRERMQSVPQDLARCQTIVNALNGRLLRGWIYLTGMDIQSDFPFLLSL
jgi:hypothetical protein